MRESLSPNAQVLLDFVFPVYDDAPLCANSAEKHARIIVAATLRAAVAATKTCQYNECWICDASELLAIADELEVQ